LGGKPDGADLIGSGNLPAIEVSLESMFIREIDPQAMDEILLVATRMRETLVEVMGEEKGTAMYTMDWLRDRVLWHLNPNQVVAKIFLSENNEEVITGQAIARVEKKNEEKYGLFSTIFVEPESRNRGIGTSLLIAVEKWFVELKIPKILYYTSDTNSNLIRLFGAHGYKITLEKSGMVQLTKKLWLKNR
jgi:GNAT superfamily N-acetyltransferase